MDVDPVGAGGVVDDGPALQGGGGFGVFGIREEDAVGGFPDGDFGDVGDAEVALAGAAVEQGEVAEALAAVVGEQLEVVVTSVSSAVSSRRTVTAEVSSKVRVVAGVGDDGEEALASALASALAGPGEWGARCRWRADVR